MFFHFFNFFCLESHPGAIWSDRKTILMSLQTEICSGNVLRCFLHHKKTFWENFFPVIFMIFFDFQNTFFGYFYTFWESDLEDIESKNHQNDRSQSSDGVVGSSAAQIQQEIVLGDSTRAEKRFGERLIVENENV